MRALFLLLFLASACFLEPRKESSISLDSGLLEELDALQIRLLHAGERVRFWEEMQIRNQQITELACQPPSDPKPPLWARKE